MFVIYWEYYNLCNYVIVYVRIVYSSLMVEIVEMFMNWGVDSKRLLYNRMLFSFKMKF